MKAPAPWSAPSSSPAAQALVGKTVAIFSGGTYAQYRTVEADQCLVLPEGTTAAQGAAAFVNPLTALGMVETMRREGHRALVHTAAASSLGQMLNRLCLKDGVSLIHVVRKPEQVTLLREQGATHVVNSASPDFVRDLTDACAATGATIAFDATGGGPLAGQILGAMEAAINRGAKAYSRYGSTTHKQVYIYGGLDPSPTELRRNFGMAWGVGGWLLWPFLHKIGPAATLDLKGAGRLRAEDDLPPPAIQDRCRSPKCSPWMRLPRSESPPRTPSIWSRRIAESASSPHLCNIQALEIIRKTLCNFQATSGKRLYISG